MAYIGKVPANVPLTSSDIADGIISTADIANTAVTGAKVNTDIISAQTALASAPADTDEFLVSDAGTIKRIDYSLIKGGGAYTKLLTTTVSSGVSEVVFNSTYITSTYTDFKIIISNLLSASEASLRLHFSTDNGSSFKDDFRYLSYQIDSNNGTGIARNDTQDAAFVDITSASALRAESDANAFFDIILFGHSDTDSAVSVQFEGGYENNSGKAVHVRGYAFDDTPSHTFNYVKIAMNSGNINNGFFTLYGRAI